MGCPNAYRFFSELSFVHPAQIGFDERWYTIDISPDTDVLFLWYALELSYDCDNFSSMWREEENEKQTRKVARMLIDKGYMSAYKYQHEDLDLKSDMTESKIFPRVLEVRKMMYSKELDHLSYGAKFAKIAKTVEELEDDYPSDWYPYSTVTYESCMDDLRAYFTWRTKYRQGKINSIPNSFVLLYVAELINGVGWTDPVKGQELLSSVFDNLDSEKYSNRVLRWLCDFSAYHNLPPSWEYMYTEAEKLIIDLLHPEKITSENIIALLNVLTDYDYNLEDKKAYQRSPKEYKEVLVRCFRNIILNGISGKDQSSKSVFVWHNDSWYEMFCTLPFQLAESHGNYTYQLDDLKRYKFEGNYCTFSVCTLSHKFTSSLQDILYTVESLMRVEVGLRKTKERLLPESEYYQCIVKAIRDWKVKKNKRVVVIDSNKLESVRQDAQETSQKIMTSEEIDNVPDVQSDVKEEKIVDVVSAETEEVDSPDESSVLDADEAAFLILLIDGLDWQKFLKTIRMMPSLIVDSVNDKLFEEFGDTVLEMRDGKPVVIEDYLEDLKRMLGL